METYNLEKIQELLRDFHYLTNMKIGIYDSAENELCYYPEKLSAFCSLLRENKDMDERCKNCDRLAFAECKRTCKQYVYTCHAGLLECISPILYEKKIIGYVVIGQIKTPENADFSKIAHRLPYKLHKPLAEKYQNLPLADFRKISSAMRILDACTGYEYLKGLVRSADSKIDARLDGYINEHLTEDLSVQSLCSHFHLSHSEIYSIFKDYFHSTPAEYIKTCRLNKACDLLKNTTLPVFKIAQQCGIPDYNYFSKTFKRAFHVSPRTFRKL